MTREQINAFLAEQQGTSIQPGYNYAIFTIRTNRPEQVAAKLRENKAKIEADAGATLVPYVCYTRPRSVVVPIPFDLGLNVLAAALEPVLAGTDAKIPSWS